MMGKFTRAALLMLVMAVPGARLALAAANQPPVPVDVEANSMEIIEANKQAIFRGAVDAVRGDQHMRSDEMVVDYADVKQPDGTMKTEVSNLDAKGNLTITTKTQVITGDWAKMNVQANTLVVGGNVKVVQGKTVLTGEKLDVDLKTNHTLMSGGRVKGSFVPK
jgi:lipopolysaccharide export system protein LptA